MPFVMIDTTPAVNSPTNHRVQEGVAPYFLHSLGTRLKTKSQGSKTPARPPEPSRGQSGVFTPSPNS